MRLGFWAHVGRRDQGVYTGDINEPTRGTGRLPLRMENAS
jgi:hypothetical protein